MNVKRYFAADMRQALRAVRDELGPDAIILANERVADGIEILATEDYDETLFATMREQSSRQSQSNDVDRDAGDRDTGDRELRRRIEAERAAAPISQRPAAAEAPTPLSTRAAAAGPERNPEPREQQQSVVGKAGVESGLNFQQLMDAYQGPVAKSTAASADAEVMAAMRSEIENLRLLLQDQLRQSSSERWKYRNPVAAAVAQRCSARGLGRKVIDGLLEQVDDITTIEDAWVAALTQLESDLPILGGDLVDKGGVVALLGPTGAGKTTTIAKLAIRYALKHGRENLALVTTDNYRVAAYDQLRTLARIIGVPVRRTDEKNSLRKILRGFKDKSLVLVDMAGFNAGDTRRREQLASLQQVGKAVSRLLVLPCTSQEQVLRAAYNLVAGEGLTGCVLSKVDEAKSMGEVLSLVLENNLPVAYITNGQAIPDDIDIAQAELLLSYLLYAGVESAVHDELSISKTLRATPMPTMNGARIL